MIKIFDFVANDSLRESLSSDYQEMVISLESGAYKAVHVLSGSIIEAVLVDYLLTTDYQAQSGKDPLKLELAPLIDACLSENIITKKVADLSTIIRNYRNLIHPARLYRLKEKVDRNGAIVAKSLVEMIVDEITTIRKETYGYTAQQVIDKIYVDPSVTAIFTDVLKSTNSIEKERLLTLIPQAYFVEESKDNTLEPVDIDYLFRLGDCFRKVFESSENSMKSNITLRFVNMIKNDSQKRVYAYGDAFFETSDIVFLSDDDKDIVKKHIIHRLPQIKLSSRIIHGVGNVLTISGIYKLVDALVNRTRVHHAEDDFVALQREYTIMSDDNKKNVIKRIELWIEALEEKEITRMVNELSSAKFTLLEDDIPF